MPGKRTADRPKLATTASSQQRMVLAEIIAIGSELLLGGRGDTNSLFLSEGLASLGVEVRFKSIVGDDQADIVNGIQHACRRARVVILTGGLGPTSDDRTREAVAQATGRRLCRHVQALDDLNRRLAEWGRTPTPELLRQGLIPFRAAVLRNAIGSAPGFALKWKGCQLVALPGVPAEAKQMFGDAVVPWLLQQPGVRLHAAEIVHQTVHTVGLPESEVERCLQGLLPPGSAIRLGLQASPLGVTVSLNASRARRGHAKQRGRVAAEVRAIVRQAKSRLGDAVYGEADETLEGVVGGQLSARGFTLAVAESCTGGLIAHRITQIPGSSSYFDRAVTCYSDEAKQELLGVPRVLIHRHGAVSAEVAAAMAEGVRCRSRTDVGLSVTGIAGPAGGTARKPVGLVYVGVDSGPTRGGHLTREFRFHGDRHMIKLRASQAALNVLRLHLMQRDQLGVG